MYSLFNLYLTRRRLIEIKNLFYKSPGQDRQLSSTFINLIFNLPVLRLQLLLLEETFQTKVMSIKSQVVNFNFCRKLVMLCSLSLSVKLKLMYCWNCFATHAFKKPLFAHGFNGCQCLEGPLVCSRSNLICFAHTQAQAAKAFLSFSYPCETLYCFTQC